MGFVETARLDIQPVFGYLIKAWGALTRPPGGTDQLFSEKFGPYRVRSCRGRFVGVIEKCRSFQPAAYQISHQAGYYTDQQVPKESNSRTSFPVGPAKMITELLKVSKKARRGSGFWRREAEKLLTNPPDALQCNTPGEKSCPPMDLFKRVLTTR